VTPGNVATRDFTPPAMLPILAPILALAPQTIVLSRRPPNSSVLGLEKTSSRSPETP
jgi:hypothetical protein